MIVEIKKLDEELQIVWAEVYAPNVPDSQNDYMTEDEIRKAAYGFMEKMRVNMVDTNHDNVFIDAVVVESFIARKGDPDFIENAWVAGIHIKDADTWAAVKSGDLNGFSFEGKAHRVASELEINVPESLVGKTMVVDGHDHSFKVFFDEDGNFIGGYTDKVDGHSHTITLGTITSEVEGHSHRFSFVEGAYE